MPCARLPCVWNSPYQGCSRSHQLLELLVLGQQLVEAEVVVVGVGKVVAATAVAVVAAAVVETSQVPLQVG